MLAARQRYSEYERKWLRVTSRSQLSQKDLIGSFAMEFDGKLIQQATVSESLSRKWAYLDVIPLFDASKERFRRRCPGKKRNHQSYLTAPINPDKLSQHDIICLTPSRSPILKSFEGTLLTQPMELICISPTAQLNELQPITGAYFQDPSDQLFSPLPNSIDLKIFGTKFISDNGGTNFSNLSTCNIDWIMADLFNALDGPYMFNLVSLFGRTVPVTPLQNSLKTLISLAKNEIRRDGKQILFERLEALLNITKELPVGSTPLASDMFGALEITPSSSLTRLPARASRNLEGKVNPVAFSYTNKEARIHFLLQEVSHEASVDLQNWMSDIENQGTKETFRSKIVLTPGSSNPKFSAVINFQQSTDWPGSIRLEQSIKFRTVIPQDSLIFRIVEHGSVQDLQRSLAKYEVSLNVCDHLGRSPLNYATRGGGIWYSGTSDVNIEMCKFLLSFMDDVNIPESPPETESGIEYIYPLDMISSSSASVMNEYFRILFKKDADPSLPIQGESFTSVVMQSFPFDALKLLLDHSTPYCSANFTGIDEEEPPLALVIKNFVETEIVFGSLGFKKYDDTAAKVILLLRRGALVNRSWVPKDDPGSVYSCLSYVLSSRCAREQNSPRSPSLRGRLVKDLLMILITAGADVYAEILHKGLRSCSALVAKHSKRQALWSKVLRTCGYNPEAVFSGERVLYTPKLSFEEYCRTRVPIRHPPRLQELSLDDEVDNGSVEPDEDFWYHSEDDVDLEQHLEEDSEEDTEESATAYEMSDVPDLNLPQSGLNYDNNPPFVPEWDLFETEAFANTSSNILDVQFDELV